MITDSEILLAKLEKKENKFLVGNILSSSFDVPLDQSTGEIIFLSQLEEICEENLKDVKKIRVAFSQQFYKIFSFPYEKALTSRDVKERLKWEFSNLYPTLDAEKFVYSHFIVRKTDDFFVYVIAVSKKFVEVIKKFAVRKNIAVDFFEHPAISSYNASKIAIKNFDVLLYLSNKFATKIINDNGKIREIKFYEAKEKFTLEEIENICGEPEKNKNAIFISEGAIADEIEKKILEMNYKPVQEKFTAYVNSENEIDEATGKYLPVLTGLLFRVR